MLGGLSFAMLLEFMVFFSCIMVDLIGARRMFVHYRFILLDVLRPCWYD